MSNNRPFFTLNEDLSRLPQVYIASAYSSDSQIIIQMNILRAVSAATALLHRYPVFPIIPHASGLHHGVTWEQAMIRCRAIIAGLDRERDAVVLLPGWESSKGATEERALAQSLGIRVLELDEALA